MNSEAQTFRLQPSVDHNKVLLVDDDPTMLRLLVTWLDLAGYDVRQATDGVQALEEIERDCPDYLITDWEMPRMDGPTLCRRVRDLRLPKYVYVVFLTSRKRRDDSVGALESGADDFLSKPMQKSELLARMMAGGRVLDLERRLSVLASIDMLTELKTRRSFFDCFQREWTRAQRSDAPLSCIIFDIDFFKRVNDQHGHAAGDACLQAVATLLKRACRGSDVVARFGGDEFVALLPESTETQATVWAERLRKKLGALTVRADGVELQMTCSFGVAQYRPQFETCAAMVAAADQALLMAKQAGRDAVVGYESVCRMDAVGTGGLDEGALFGSATAQEVMTPCAVILEGSAPAESALKRFLDGGVTCAPVVDENGKLCGLLTDKKLAEMAMSPQSWSRPIEELMTTNVVSYEQATPASAIGDFLCRVGMGQVVIVEQDVPTGIVGRNNLLQWADRRASSDVLTDLAER